MLNDPRPKLWEALSGRQVFITGLEASSPSVGPAITITDLVPDQDHYHGRGGRVYPLWATAHANHSNVRQELLELLAEAYGMPVSPEDLMAYIAAVMTHRAFTARFEKDLNRPGLRLPLTADAALFTEAVSLGREVIWLHCYGERYVDTAAGRPKGPPRLSKDKAPQIPAMGAIPPAPEPLPATVAYDAPQRRLLIGKGFIENVTPEMWEYNISGKQVIWQWFSNRRRDRTKPLIGDRRPPSPLEKFQPEGWVHEYTTDLLDLLNVLGRVIQLEPAQAALLTRICDATLISKDSLKEAGLVDETAAEATEEEI